MLKSNTSDTQSIKPEKSFWNTLFGDSSSSEESESIKYDINTQIQTNNATTTNDVEINYESHNLDDDIDKTTNIKDNTNTIHGKIIIINSQNNLLNNFINTFCKSTYTDDIVRSIYIEISDNQELYETESFRISNLKYRLCNSLSNYEKINDNFFDIGYNNIAYSTNLNEFKHDNIFEDNHQLREIILFDPVKDSILRSIYLQTETFLKDNNIYNKIIEIIINHLGKETEDFKFNKFMADYSSKNKSNVLYIGDAYCGVDRHKSLLFKYICDKLNLPCYIFRNITTNDNKIYDNHVWNLICIDRCVYIVDFKTFSHKIVKATDIDTENYYKINQFLI